MRRGSIAPSSDCTTYIFSQLLVPDDTLNPGRLVKLSRTRLTGFKKIKEEIPIEGEIGVGRSRSHHVLLVLLTNDAYSDSEASQRHVSGLQPLYVRRRRDPVVRVIGPNLDLVVVGGQRGTFVELDVP